MTPLTPAERAAVAEVLARGIPADDPPPPPTLREVLAATACSFLIVGGFVGMFLGAAWVHGWRPV